MYIYYSITIIEILVVLQITWNLSFLLYPIFKSASYKLLLEIKHSNKTKASTARRGKSVPPHNISDKSKGVSSLFSILHPLSWNSDWMIQLQWSLPTTLLLLLSFIFLAFMIGIYRMKQSPYLVVFVGVLWVLLVFLTILTSIVPSSS